MFVVVLNTPLSSHVRYFTSCPCFLIGLLLSDVDPYLPYYPVSLWYFCILCIKSVNCYPWLWHLHLGLIPHFLLPCLYNCDTYFFSLKASILLQHTHFFSLQLYKWNGSNGQLLCFVLFAKTHEHIYNLKNGAQVSGHSQHRLHGNIILLVYILLKPPNCS